MHKVTLQVPMNQQLKIDAEKAAIEQGFSSLQELVRVILSKVAQKKIEVNFEEENVIHLSPKAEKRYLKATKDFEEGRNVYSASSVKELMKQLNGN